MPPVTSRTVTRGWHTLPDGLKLELLHRPAEGRDSRDASTPPLLFIHGSGHAAWCWQVGGVVSALTMC